MPLRTWAAQRFTRRKGCHCCLETCQRAQLRWGLQLRGKRSRTTLRTFADNPSSVFTFQLQKLGCWGLVWLSPWLLSDLSLSPVAWSGSCSWAISVLTKVFEYHQSILDALSTSRGPWGSYAPATRKWLRLLLKPWLLLWEVFPPPHLLPPAPAVENFPSVCQAMVTSMGPCLELLQRTPPIVLGTL